MCDVGKVGHSVGTSLIDVFPSFDYESQLLERQLIDVVLSKSKGGR